MRRPSPTACSPPVLRIPHTNTADAVATHIPVTNPFLKELMETFLHLGGRKRKERGGDGIDFDELGVSEVVGLLDAANMG